MWDVYVRVNNRTRSRSSCKSSFVGGSNCAGCLEDIARRVFRVTWIFRGRHDCRKHREVILYSIGEAILVFVKQLGRTEVSGGVYVCGSGLSSLSLDSIDVNREKERRRKEWCERIEK